jgi:hypothetical protein
MMAVLEAELRRLLEKTVARAREVAEFGARAAIEQLAVHRPEPFAHLSAEQRDLRNRLRARARQLGDRRDARSGEHQIDHLVVECAYEHWHRMLFARFLAENNVLMHPDGVAVTLEECEELAPDEGAEDGWELAAWYAAEMLPQIFRPDAPVLEVKLPPERQRELERLLADLPPDVFKASDSLGWVYQFWQAKKKDEVNKSEVKIGADELPAVTQLFTEPYMVQFLLHNTLGAWWVGRHGRESLPLDMPYLRFLDDGTPAAGTFDGWPDTAAELKVLDPCCGSGHFLVAADGRGEAGPGRGLRRRAARQHPRAGDRRALHADRGLCPRPGGMDLPGGRGPSRAARNAHRMLWARAACEEERVVGSGG